MLNYRQIRQHQLENRRHPSPARGSKILVLGFSGIILIGTVLLKLPFATENPQNFGWLEALFTATSAVTVTGLVVVPTEDTFTYFGEIVILGLIQIGGTGFIVISIILFHLIGRRVRLYERDLVRQDLGIEAGAGIVQLTRIVFRGVILTELVGATILFSQWVQVMDWQYALYFSIFHAISAFCNAGFDLFHGLDDPFLVSSRANVVIVLVLSGLITLGTLGITVIHDIIIWPRNRQLSLHTKLILPFTITLTIIGMILLMIDEIFVEGHALSVLPRYEQWLLAFFSIVSSRTAGITLISLADLGDASQIVIFVWMFIGGAPASMGGGVGLSTVAVVLVTLFTTIRGYNDVRVFRRTIPLETLTKAVAVITVSTILVVGVTLLMALLNEGTLFPVAFEVVSAFSNTGYSLGITDQFSTPGRLLLILTMFWGRLGPLTLVVALAQRRRQSLLKYPEEKIIIG